MAAPHVLHTTVGDVELEEYHLALDGRAWRVLHAGAILSEADEQRFLGAERRLPYGIVLWPAAIALAHEVCGLPVAGLRVLELGAGTGLPGIVAATRGAHVTQTDNLELALHVCRLNAERNDATSTRHRIADWTAWDDTERYDCILGADVLYGRDMHPHLRRIFEANLAPGGSVLLSDPLRKTSFPLVEAMGADGWDVGMNKWTVEGAASTSSPRRGEKGRAIGVFTLTRGPGSPGSARTGAAGPAESTLASGRRTLIDLGDVRASRTT